VAGDGTPGAAAADRNASCTCRSGRATGSLDLSEDSVGGPPPASPDTSVGSAAGY
jgi:hypothetical protein